MIIMELVSMTLMTIVNTLRKSENSIYCKVCSIQMDLPFIRFNHYWINFDLLDIIH